MDKNYLIHYGILGMKWGVRRFQPYPKGEGHKGTFKGKKPSEHKVSGLRNKISQNRNQKVDEGFNKWKTGSENRKAAIDLGKQANIAKRALDSDKKNKDLKSEYKNLNKEYKKALKENTTYRKGQVKKEVRSDLSRKYLSDAKQIEKKLLRDKARRAPEVAAKRSQKIASLKRARTIAVKTAVTTAAVAGGTTLVNSYLQSKGQTGLRDDAIRNAMDMGKKMMKAAGYIY